MSIINQVSSAIVGIVLLVVSTIAPAITPRNNSSNNQSPQSLTFAPNASISRNWAGYSATGGTYTGVSATWIVPQVQGTSPGADATWVGVGGVNSDDLIQAGTQATVNNFGQTTYTAFYETLPDMSQPFNIPMSQGDSVSVSLAKDGQNAWKITVTNNTRHQSAITKVHYDSSLSSADWIEEAPSGVQQVMPLDDFGTVYLSNAKAINNGESITAAQAGAQPIAMSATGGANLLAQASILNSDGQSFAVARTNANSQEIENSQQSSPGVVYQRGPDGGGNGNPFLIIQRHRHY